MGGIIGLLGWIETGYIQPLGTNLVREAQAKVRFIQTKLLDA